MTEYVAPYWPTPGEMILLLQGIDPWSGEYSPAQKEWLALVAPYINVPMLSRHYTGSTEIGRSFSAAALASRAGGSVMQAFRDAWMGKHKEKTGRRLYRARYANKDIEERSWWWK